MGYPNIGNKRLVKINYPDLNSNELLGDEAFNLVKNVLESCKDKWGNYKLSKTQIRRFFSEVKDIENNLGNEMSAALYGKIKLLKAKAVYNTGRKSNALPKPFADLISYYVDQIKIDEPDCVKKYRNFCLLFEAFVGYSAVYKLSM